MSFKNINADELELFVVTQIQDALRNWNPSEVARKYIKRNTRRYSRLYRGKARIS